MSVFRMRLFFLLCLVLLLPFLSAGCSSSPPVPPGDQRMNEIAKKSEGDWSKVSQADRDFITKDIARGSEQSAQMLLMARWGRIKGGPPNPGAVR